MAEGRLVFDSDDIRLARLRVPDGTGKDMLVDLNEVFRAEARCREVAFVNAQKAPELLMVFNLAYLACNDIQRQLELNLHYCMKARDMRQSIVILDIAPKFLASKGVLSARAPGGSEDQRQAVLNQDTEYLDRCDDVAGARAAVELLKGKARALEQAYTSVKKILGDNKDGWHGLSQNRHLSAGAEPTDGPPPGRSHPGFGPRK